MRQWDSLLDRYLEQYAARGLATETVAHTRRELERLGCWLKNRKPKPQLTDVGSDQLIDYLRHRTAYRAKATLCGAMSTLRGWGEFLVQQGVWSANPLRWMRGPKLSLYQRVPRRIPRDAMQRLWEQAATSRQNYHRYLWLAALSLLYGTGLRRGEVLRMKLDDWSAQDGTLRIDGRKTGQERQVAVPELTIRCLETYLPHRHNHLEALGLCQEQALLVSQEGGPLSPMALSRGIQRLARRAGLEDLTLHQFRHTCASDLLEQGVHLPEVQRLLGHQTITTTVRYLHVADPQRHEAARRHPINQILAVADQKGCTQSQPISAGEQS